MTLATTSMHSLSPELELPKGFPSAKSHVIGIACFAIPERMALSFGRQVAIEQP